MESTIYGKLKKLGGVYVNTIKDEWNNMAWFVWWLCFCFRWRHAIIKSNYREQQQQQQQQ